MDLFYILMGSGMLALPAIFGAVMKIFPPKNINSIYGFRTKASSKNDTTWKYAQKLAANLLILFYISLILVYFAIVGIDEAVNFVNDRFWLMILGIVFAGVGLIVPIIIVQIKTAKFAKHMDSTLEDNKC